MICNRIYSIGVRDHYSGNGEAEARRQHPRDTREAVWVVPSREKCVVVEHPKARA